MIKNERILLLFVIIFLLLFQTGTKVFGTSLTVQEVLSIKTGRGNSNIGNQFITLALEPYKGFAVDSRGNIFICDPVNNRITRFSTEGTSNADITAGRFFCPGSICIGAGDIIFTHDAKKEEIIAFSSDSKLLTSFNPANSVFKKKYKHVPIMSFFCNETIVKVIFGIKEPKIIRPVFEDDYNQYFNLISRKIYNNEIAYYKELRGEKKIFEKRFEDLNGHLYGYPIVTNWYGKFLPLQKFSAEGTLLMKIDGPFLTKHTKYKVYDYYTGKDKLGLELSKNIGKDFMIVNWYVMPSGTIYALLANNDYLKVLQIKIT